jgi:hypothetical protein
MIFFVFSVEKEKSQIKKNEVPQEFRPNFEGKGIIGTPIPLYE